MDSYKTILEKKDYDLLLALTEGDDSPQGLIYRAAAFLAKGDAKTALKILKANEKKLYENNPLGYMKSLFDIRFILKQFDEAYDEMLYFENLPYVNQEVEEYLRALPKIIRSEERNSSINKDYDSEEMKDKLALAKDDYEVLNLLNLIGPLKANQYTRELVHLVEGNRGEVIRTYALLFLVAGKCDKEVTFKKRDKEFVVVPKNLVPPYTGKDFESFAKSLSEYNNDPSIAGAARKVLDNYVFDIYPELPDLKGKHDVYLLAFSSIGHELLGSEFDLELAAKEKNVSSEEVKKLKETIKKVREKEETLSF